jgi:deoxyadenosine/deoxycytidine kinase
MTVVIDGNIGAGKTTQLDMLELVGHNVHKEPVQDWPLDKYYQNPQKWAFLLQIAILESNMIKMDVEIYERGPIPGRMVFWEDLVMRGVIERIEEHYWYDKLWERLKWYPKKYIFLNVPPEVSFERVRARHQKGDAFITLKSLQHLHARYMKMLETIGEHCEVHILDGTRDTPAIHAEVLKIIQEVN